VSVCVFDPYHTMADVGGSSLREPPIWWTRRTRLPTGSSTHGT
jgi:hypothetical protein